MEYLCLISKDDTEIRLSHLGDRLIASTSTLNQEPAEHSGPVAINNFDSIYEMGLEAYMDRLEQSILEKLLAVNEGCMETLARTLKTSRSTLYRKLKKFEEPSLRELSAATCNAQIAS
jgi:transcriptional regulator of acetoin/glycerol metabolism